MSDRPLGEGWWIASDGRWYAPELHPDVRLGAHGAEARHVIGKVPDVDSAADADANSGDGGGVGAGGQPSADGADDAPAKSDGESARAAKIAAEQQRLREADAGERSAPGQAAMVAAAQQAQFAASKRAGDLAAGRSERASQPLPPLPARRPAPTTSVPPVAGAAAAATAATAATAAQGAAGADSPAGGLVAPSTPPASGPSRLGTSFNVGASAGRRPKRSASASAGGGGRRALLLTLVVLATVGIAYGAYSLVDTGSTAPPSVSTMRAIVLQPTDFPSGWKVVHATAGDGGPASQALFGPIGAHRAWIAAHPACAPLLAAIRSAGTALPGEPSAAITSHFRQQVRLGAIWFVSSKVTLRTTAGEVVDDQALVRSQLARHTADGCLAAYFHAVLGERLPTGSKVVDAVTQPAVASLAGDPSSWAVAMRGAVTIHGTALPINYEMVDLGTGRTEMVFTTESGLATLIRPLDERLLDDLAARAAAHPT